MADYPARFDYLFSADVDGADVAAAARKDDRCSHIRDGTGAEIAGVDNEEIGELADLKAADVALEAEDFRCLEGMDLGSVNEQINLSSVIEAQISSPRPTWFRIRTFLKLIRRLR